MDFRDSYTLNWTLLADDGDQYVETHKGISLSDFETIYGNEVNQIKEMELKMDGR